MISNLFCSGRPGIRLRHSAALVAAALISGGSARAADTLLFDNLAAFGGPQVRAGPGDRLSDKLMRLYTGGKLVPETLGPYHIEL